MSGEALFAWTGLLVGAYLLGSLSFGYLLVRWIRGEDLRRLGSGNAGATNAYRAAGRLAGAGTLLLDVAKGALAVLAARWLAAPETVVGAAAVAVVVGHAYPIFFGFRGGKGVATSFGAMVSLAPWPALAVLPVFAAVVTLTGLVSLASVVGAALFPVLVVLLPAAGWVEEPSLPLKVSAVTLAALVILWHRSNLRRLLRGTEPRVHDPVERR